MRRRRVDFVPNPFEQTVVLPAPRLAKNSHVRPITTRAHLLRPGKTTSHEEARRLAVSEL